MKKNDLGKTFFSTVPERICTYIFKSDNSILLYLVSVVLFGAFPWMIFIYGFLSSFNIEKSGPALFVSILFASLWIIIGPLLIFRWERSYSKFVKILISFPKIKRQRLPGRPTLKILMHKKWSWLWGAIISLFTLYYYFIGKDEISNFSDIHDRPITWLFTLLVITYAGFCSGYGFSGVWQSINLFGNLGNFCLRWNPFHWDGRGGFEFLGRFALDTWFCFSGGFIVVPAIINIGSLVTDNSILVIYFALSVYTILNLLIFLVPVLSIASGADVQKEKILQSWSKDLGSSNYFSDRDEWNQKGEIVRLQGLFYRTSIKEVIERISVYPVSYYAISRVLVVSMLPIFAAAVDSGFDYLVGNSEAVTPTISKGAYGETLPNP